MTRLVEDPLVMGKLMLTVIRLIDHSGAATFGAIARELPYEGYTTGEIIEGMGALIELRVVEQVEGALIYYPGIGYPRRIQEET